MFPTYLGIFLFDIIPKGLPSWLSGKESACQRRRCVFYPCVRPPRGGNGDLL